MSQQKPNQIEKVKISYSKFEKYFSRGTPQAHIEAIIFKALDEYYEKRKKWFIFKHDKLMMKNHWFIVLFLFAKKIFEKI